MDARPRRVIWAYDREHTLHPFIVLGLRTLADEGWSATVVSADKARNAPYRSYASFSFDKRIKNYMHVAFTVRNKLERDAVEIKRARQRIERRLAETDADRQVRGAKRLRFQAKARTLFLAHESIQGWRAVLKWAANIRRLTIDTWDVYLRGFARLMKLDGEVMIASRPEAAFWACLVAKLKRMRFVYFPFELYGEQITRPNPLVAAFERFMLKRCVDAVLTQNECRARILVEERGARVEPLIVHNYKPIRPEDRPLGRLRARHGIGPDKKIVLYEGVIVDGRWLEFVAQSVLHLPEDVVVVMMGQEKLKWRSVHAEEIKAALATGRLILAGPVPHEELLDYVADADVGVIIYDDSVRNNVFCEPGKLSDYISVGVPVVAPNFPTIGPVVRGYGLGLCFDGHSPQAIAATLTAVLETPKSSWAGALRRACAELTWETQVPNLLAAVQGERPEKAPAASAATDAPLGLGVSPASYKQ
jgi:glycosyltransferase involved in cell wall biosynthesis